MGTVLYLLDESLFRPHLHFDERHKVEIVSDTVKFMTKITTKDQEI